MRKERLIIYLITLLALTGCEGVRLPSYDQQIVVEGWIENEGFPVVMLTTTVPVNSVKDSVGLKEHIIRWGKVTISDGESEVILTGRKDDRYFPPYVYTTSKMRGETGKDYYLTVEYSGRKVTAVTSIPEPVPLEYVRIHEVKESGEDVGSKRYQLIGGLKDNRDRKDYYKVFTKVHGQDSSFVSSFLGLTDDAILSDEIREIPINRGYVHWKEKNYFKSGDIVSVRFCTLTSQGYEYWSDFEEIQSLSQNPFFPITTDIRSNIQGGLGYWTGYGSTYYSLEIGTESSAIQDSEVTLEGILSR